MRRPLLYLVIGICFIVLAGCSYSSKHNEELLFSGSETSDSIQNKAILIPFEAITLDYFPCNDCHSDREPNPTRRVLVDMHDDIVFDHDSANRWCLACHNTDDRNYLRLADGRLLEFNESYKLCGQCHGPKYRDWKLGIHGKRTGEWNGKKQYYLCVHCHDPHSPKFKSLKPLPPPRKPENIKIDSIDETEEKISTTP